MLRFYKLTNFREKVQSVSLVGMATVMALAGISPVLFQGTANAATLTSRSVTIASSQADATGVTYDFVFTTQSASSIQSLVFQFCSTPLGTCTLPGGAGAANKIDVSQVTASTSDTLSADVATAFADYAGADAGACTESDGGSGVATMFCATRTAAGSETAGSKNFTITGISNPTINAGNNEPVYVRVATYSDTAFATNVDSGTVAAAIVNQLTVTGRVQERLSFCVFALEDSAASSGTVGTAATNFPDNCTAAEATASSNVDIGVVDNLSIARAPVDNTPPTSLGNDRIGAAMINTNASLGVSLTYFATAATTGTNELRAFRVSGATCNVSGTSVVDQCFISADDAAGETFTAGTERFGLNIVCKTDSATTTAGTTANLGSGGNGAGTGNTFNTVYANNDTTLAQIQDTGADNCENNAGETNKYGWNDTSTAQALISANTVVDDELVKLRFAATANATTPTGTYTAASTFIATPTF